MQSLNYIGSKRTLIGTIIQICVENVGINEMHKKTCMDLFAGTGVVGFHLQNMVSTMSANDLEYYSFVINSAILGCNYSIKLQTIIDDCNQLAGIDGLIYQNYSPHSECERMFFTNQNAMKCDAIRTYIETLHTTCEIVLQEFYYLLASLLVSIDKVANTSCVYGAYLKKFKTSACKTVVI